MHFDTLHFYVLYLNGQNPIKTYSYEKGSW